MVNIKNPGFGVSKTGLVLWFSLGLSCDQRHPEDGLDRQGDGGGAGQSIGINDLEGNRRVENRVVHDCAADGTDDVERIPQGAIAAGVPLVCIGGSATCDRALERD